MTVFSIKELERLSSVKAHTIRTWEKRYRLLTPSRESNNIRYYSLRDVLLLINIELLLQQGHKISRVAVLSPNEIELEVNKIASDDGRQKIYIRDLVSSMFTNDIEQFETELDESVQTFGVQSTIDNVIMPFLERVSLMSYGNSTVEAHFVVTAVRKKIILGIEAVTKPEHASKSILLFLPEGEHYDLVLLYLYYTLKSEGFKVYYLGTNISVQNLATALDQKTWEYLCCYVADTKRPLNNYLEMLTKSSNLGRLFLTYAESSVRTKVREHSQIKHCHYNLLPGILKTE